MWWATLAGLFLNIAGSVVGRVLLALGMGYVTYTGFDLAIGSLLTQIKSNMSAMPAEALNFLGFLWVDKCIGMVFSAYATAAFIKMAGNTKLTKLVTKA